MLNPQKYEFFTAKELKPSGWLKRQLKIQADGLCGNLDRVWPDIRDSRWIGGYCEGWERVPYWLDGFIPMAWLLEDTDLQARATRFVDEILARQQEDGWICPCEQNERAMYDMWAAFLICKVLVVYHDCTGDGRIEDAVYRALRSLQQHLDSQSLFNWGATRWFECLIPLFWLYERRPEEWMIDLAHVLKVQGADYNSLFRHWRSSLPNEKGRWTYLTHVVNMGMCLKSDALFCRLTGEDPGEFAKNALDTLLRDHGMAVGHFTGDECLSGTSPIQGSECCSVVEAMYSYEWLYALTGDPAWADRLEDLAFNALPATTTVDMWGHQYDQLTNQVQCTQLEPEHVHFSTNRGDSHLFGLEPNYGCCTANFGQGWPKFALSTLYRAGDGIVVGAISPCVLTAEICGVNVRCEIVTDYPFEDGYTVRVSSDKPVSFPLTLRIPAGAVSASVNGSPAEGASVLTEVSCADSTEITVQFDFAARLVPMPGKYSDLVSVRRGPLVFALPIAAQWNRLEYEKNGVERKFPYCDYELIPTSPWNFAFTGEDFRLQRGGVPDMPFDGESAPVRLGVTLRPVDWPLINGVCRDRPLSTEAAGDDVRMELIPYGCTDLRMTAMPLCKK